MTPAFSEPTWVLVPGGTCLFGDNAKPLSVPPLLWSTTPVPHGWVEQDRPDRAALPLTGITHTEAATVARRFGGRLPTSVEWEWMATGPRRRLYPWGEEPWSPGLANLAPAGMGGPSPVGAHPAGATPEGVLDVAGNVWEWTSRTTMGNGAVIRGGSYVSQPLYARCTFLNAAPRELRSPGIGVRVVREP
ncbi:formylglycine-generating enzyme family protein [Nocardiopsis dassonvillei]|uniref:formylglycine-generating enzyme family protein n=1 Tax=Nocardiopsis dassonvillei TaxID=2014 RepID=UPI0005BB400D|nr:SUMF1/EgtB/PvdO family nonheme iron enzyme [Nocardiopsis dassonvillei]MCK9872397.1 SUMF1/EgtB/PvdO family nonheme iron enzyme [Nocardiopsis dassonvillei]